jgi:hypothetical protein
MRVSVNLLTRVDNEREDWHKNRRQKYRKTRNGEMGFRFFLIPTKTLVWTVLKKC